MKSRFRVFAVAAVAAASISCGDVVRDSRSPVILVVNQLQGSLGNGGSLGSPVLSDVITNVRAPAPCTPASPCPTVFNDVAQATFSLSMKDVLVTPTSNNQVRLNRYTVVYRRNDGRNVPGVDVPYPWDGALTAVVGTGGSTTVGFELTRVVAKQESPLAQLVANPNVITAYAEITFYGEDLVGNAVTATGRLQMEFGNFGDF